MDKIINQFFSMKMMAFAMFVFLAAIGTATFLESVYDIQTAKLLIYNATWFEIVLAYLSLNLISNIFKYKLFRREKIATLAFHLSFLVIIIGAAITRFVSFEGLMIVPEGEKSNFIYSSDPKIWFKVNDGEMEYKYETKIFQSEIWHNHFNFAVEFPKHSTPISISFVNFQKNHVDSLVKNDTIKGSVLEIVTDGMSSNFVGENDFMKIGEVALSYNKKDAMPGIQVYSKSGVAYMKSAYDMTSLSMNQMRAARQSGGDVPDSAYTQIPKDKEVVFQTATLYQVDGKQFVFKGLVINAKKMLLPGKTKTAGMDYLTVEVKDGEKSMNYTLEGGMGKLPVHHVFEFNGLTYEMEYGSTRIQIPFSIACRDFQLDRYPGSNSPSSFASELTIVDPKNGVNRNKRVFMNNVMDYGGYRFFQSGYSQDEKETHLSVNHDALGTNATYLGYLLMSIGMILSLFAPAGRFRDILNKLKGLRARKELLAVLLLLSFHSFGQEHVHEPGDTTHNHEADEPQVIGKRKMIQGEFMSEEHSDKLAKLAVQDFKGRIIPMHTLCDELLRKISRKSEFNGKNAVQTVVSMHMYPEYWMSQNVIYVANNLVERLKLPGNYCAFNDFFSDDMQLKWAKEYNSAFRKPESQRNEFDKKLIKAVEKIQVLNQIFMWEYMKIIPAVGDANNSWYNPLSPDLSDKSQQGSELGQLYFNSIALGARDKNFSESDKILEGLITYQRKIGKDVIPSESHINMEVRSNKMNIFPNASYLYLTLAFIGLIFFFIEEVGQKDKKKISTLKKINTAIRWLVIPVVLYHAAGLGMRWYITGHAPWSNAYEVLIFVSLVAVVIGWVFSRKYPVVLAGAMFLAFLMMFVSTMSFLDPEITPLQPVLKSYWLKIHVAIITGSYAFLALGWIIGFINLVLYILRNERIGRRLTNTITSLNYISEIIITVGLFMLTIGTFLGGVWANESWGRYWGWDPKETWALVSVLVYAIILHFRFIPGLSGKFAFNVAIFWGFTAILFTFFGVNFYLVGLHSYAQGDGLGTFPPGIIISVIFFILFTVFAAIRNRKYEVSNKAELK